MTVLQLAGASAIVLLASTSIGYAGPCSAEIDSMQTRVDARLEAKAAAGPSAKESTDALAHRQPTPSSIARAEERLREMSAETVAAVKQALGRARAADSAGDKNACEQALAEVQRLIGP
jgi:type II secretory pathway component PulM